MSDKCPQPLIEIPRSVVELATKRGLSKSKEIIEITKPLRQLDIQGFSHCKYIGYTRVVHINSNPDYLNVYLKKLYHYNSNSFSESHLKNKIVGFFNPYFLLKKMNECQIANDQRKMGMKTALGITLHDKASNITESFFFYSNTVKPEWIYKQLSSSEKLAKYILYFKEKTNQFYQEISVKPAEVNELINPPRPEILTGNYPQNLLHKNDFDLGITQYNFGYPFTSSLSLREYDCLKMVYTGLTAKQIGNRLSISYRTVEKHLANIRQKANHIDLNLLRQKLFKNQLFQLYIRNTPSI